MIDFTSPNITLPAIADCVIVVLYYSAALKSIVFSEHTGKQAEMHVNLPNDKLDVLLVLDFARFRMVRLDCAECEA